MIFYMVYGWVIITVVLNILGLGLIAICHAIDLYMNRKV
jgi:hypothetical protein